jgi:hypothetical protein
MINSQSIAAKYSKSSGKTIETDVFNKYREILKTQNSSESEDLILLDKLEDWNILSHQSVGFEHF